MAQCAFAIITKEQRVLLVQIAPPFKPAHGWNFPGGVIEVGETLESGLLREVLEETGITCRVLHLAESFTTSDPDNEIHTYKAAFVSGEIEPQYSEIESAGWFTIQEALALPLAFENVRSHLKKLNPAQPHPRRNGLGR